MASSDQVELVALGGSQAWLKYLSSPFSVR
jgi:hypothetical protein